MNFRTFKQNKLVRDKIVSLMESQGSKLYSFQLNDHDFNKQLKIKLQEEAAEVLQAQTPQELIEELSDVLEIVHALANLHNISSKDLSKAQEKKRIQKGGFEGRTFVTFAEHPKDSPQERYCLADCEKYPEVKSQQ